jgi:hypothetical protein
VGEQVGQEVLAQVDLLIRQGSDVSFVLKYAESDGTAIVVQSFAGWSARSQIRKKVGGDVWHGMTSTDGLALTDDSAGTLTVTGLIGHTVTEDTAWNGRREGVWDLELIRADGWVIPLAAGVVRVEPDVTRSVP